MVLVSLNRYHREQFNKSEPLALLDLVAQLASAMATFALCSNVDSILAREARTHCGCGWPMAQPVPSARCYAPRDSECISMTNHVFTPRPIVPTNQMHYDTKWHFLKYILYIIRHCHEKHSIHRNINNTSILRFKYILNVMDWTHKQLFKLNITMDWVTNQQLNRDIHIKIII